MIIVLVTILRDFMGQTNHGTKEELLQNSFFFHRQSMGMPPRHHPISGARYIGHPRFEGPGRVWWSLLFQNQMYVLVDVFLNNQVFFIIIHLILKTVLTPFEKNINHQWCISIQAPKKAGTTVGSRWCQSLPGCPIWLTHSEIDPTRFWDHYPLKRHIATYSNV